MMRKMLTVGFAAVAVLIMATPVDAMENLSAKSENQRGKGGARANGDGTSHTAAKGVAGQGFSISK